jgi:hypothetical protein
MTHDELIEGIAKGLFFLNSSLSLPDHAWKYVSAEKKAVLLAQARFVWSFVDDKQAATKVDSRAVSEH